MDPFLTSRTVYQLGPAASKREGAFQAHSVCNSPEQGKDRVSVFSLPRMGLFGALRTPLLSRNTRALLGPDLSPLPT